MKYKCIFFDLDHTLWDYEKNAHEALEEIFNAHALQERGVINFEMFSQQFREINFKLWDLYDRDMITNEVIRKERFKQTLEPFKIFDEAFFLKLSDEYLRICPLKSNLIPQALETLNYLSTKYKLSIITNGFDEIQHIKLNSASVSHFFDHVVTMQKSGYKKPSKQIFDYAMHINGINAHEAVMIGDNLITDIGGARNASIDTIYFNPHYTAHEDEVNYEIQTLKELCSIL